MGDCGGLWGSGGVRDCGGVGERGTVGEWGSGGLWGIGTVWLCSAGGVTVWSPGPERAEAVHRYRYAHRANQPALLPSLVLARPDTQP